MRIETEGAGDTKATQIGKMTIKEPMVIRYPSGKIWVSYLFDNTTQHFADYMHQHVQKGYDNLCVIWGGEGSGKSNLAYALCKAFDPDFKIEDQYVYSVDDLKAKLDEGNDMHQIFWLDEGSNIANNREWSSQDSRDIISLLEMMRSRGWTLVMCIPSWERLDIYIRENRMRYLVHCEPMSFPIAGYKERGYYEIRIRENTGKMRTVGYGEYDVMPDDDKAIYETIKLQSQQKKITEIVDRKKGGTYKAKFEEGQRRLASAASKIWATGQYSAREMADMFGYKDVNAFRHAISNLKDGQK